MTADVIRLVVTRPAMVYGRRCEIGARVELPPEAALDAVETGRLGFADPADRARCLEARRHALAKELRRPPADPGDPWRPARYT